MRKMTPIHPKNAKWVFCYIWWKSSCKTPYPIDRVETLSPTQMNSPSLLPGKIIREVVWSLPSRFIHFRSHVSAHKPPGNVVGGDAFSLFISSLMLYLLQTRKYMTNEHTESCCFMAFYHMNVAGSLFLIPNAKCLCYCFFTPSCISALLRYTYEVGFTSWLPLGR